MTGRHKLNLNWLQLKFACLLKFFFLVIFFFLNFTFHNFSILFIRENNNKILQVVACRLLINDVWAYIDLNKPKIKRSM